MYLAIWLVKKLGLKVSGPRRSHSGQCKVEVLTLPEGQEPCFVPPPIREARLAGVGGPGERKSTGLEASGSQSLAGWNARPEVEVLIRLPLGRKWGPGFLFWLCIFASPNAGWNLTSHDGNYPTVSR